MRTPASIVVVGSINTDFQVRCERLPSPGETVRGDLFFESPGGKGANQAVAAARLGAGVILIGRTGTQSRSDAVIGRLQREGIDLSYLLCDADLETGVAVIMVDQAGEKSIAVYPGANAMMSRDDVRRGATAIASADALLVQLEVSDEVVGEAVRIAHGAHVRTVLDPAPARPLGRDLLSMIDVIRPNASEAAALTGIHVHDRPSARAAARKLLDQGVGTVAVQSGEEGNLIVTADEEIWLPKIPMFSIDSTGAGDAFVAGLAVALAEGHPWKKAGEFANAAAALATTALGAQTGMPTRSVVLELLRTQGIQWPQEAIER